MENTRATDHNSGAFIGATLLILIGVFALLANLVGSAYVYEAIPLALGLAFLVAYALTRQYGFLVPGGILSGVGAGVLTSSMLNASDGGPYIVLSIGLGFLAIFGIDVLVTGKVLRWWPLIPGGLMLMIGTGIASESQGAVRQLQIWAPVLLIALGVLILASRLRNGRRS